MIEEAISKRNRLSYRDAGVDIDAGTRLVDAIRPLARATARSGVTDELGGFGAGFDLAAAGYRDPILVSATDGVGTKLKIAQAANRHDTVGIDLVAMCVNDLVVQGAEPLWFLDYFACGVLDVETTTAVVTGIAEGCKQAGCALIGGETAEMPGMYAPGDYDLAGFSVGAVERGAAFPRADIAAGDTILGLSASGLHSNGFSLVRRVLEMTRLDYEAPAPFEPSLLLADVLLTPTRIYVPGCLAAARSGALKGLAHITGGGLIENLPRVLPPGVGAEIGVDRWRLPPVFRWLAESGGVAAIEMARTFNCGIGMIALCAPDRAAELSAVFAEHGETAIEIGRLVERANDAPAVALVAVEDNWGN